MPGPSARGRKGLNKMSFDDTKDWRYFPTHLRGTDNVMHEVARFLAHPPGQHPEKCPIIDTMTAVECVLSNGERRWFGVEGAMITPDLYFAGHGGCINERNEVTRRWQVFTLGKERKPYQQTN